MRLPMRSAFGWLRYAFACARWRDRMPDVLELYAVHGMTREAAVAIYEAWLRERPLLEDFV
jgi:hypothetical protein